MFIIIGISITMAGQVAEKAPEVKNSGILKSTNAFWDLQNSFNSTIAAAGDVGMAAIAFYNNEFWVSCWQSDTLYRFTQSGTLISEFIISGLTGVRAITTDGTYLYMANNTKIIYRVNPSSQTLAPPHITSFALYDSRFITYDSTLNSGNGGFWSGNFSTDIEAISLSGALLSSIPAATHGLSGMYGAAFDNVSQGGPYLWVFCQMAPNNCQVNSIKIADGTGATYTHDVYAELQGTYGLSSGLAGGAFFTNELVTGKNSFIGLVQGSPYNVIFAYEISPTPVGINKINNGVFNTSFHPGYKCIRVTFPSKKTENGKIRLFNINGRQISIKDVPPGTSNYELPIKDMKCGVYLISYSAGKKNYLNKIIIY